MAVVLFDEVDSVFGMVRVLGIPSSNSESTFLAHIALLSYDGAIKGQ
jgi:hypothetical protein